jgi:hypothetical protein
LNIFGQDIIAGLQYTVDGNKNQQQLASLSDPVEYNNIENIPLQGTKNNNMNSLYNSLSPSHCHINLNSFSCTLIF